MRKPYFISIPLNIRLVLLNSDKLLSTRNGMAWNGMNVMNKSCLVPKVKLNRLQFTEN